MFKTNPYNTPQEQHKEWQAVKIYLLIGFLITAIACFGIAKFAAKFELQQIKDRPLKVANQSVLS